MARGGRRGRPKVRHVQLETRNQASDSQAIDDLSDTLNQAIEVESGQQIDSTVTATVFPSRVFPSYAAMVDPDEGTTLEFLPASVINGTKCAKLAEEDVAGEIDYWQNAVICCVLGANPPYEIMDVFVRRIWEGMAIDKVLMIKKGLYLVRFSNKEDAIRVA